MIAAAVGAVPSGHSAGPEASQSTLVRPPCDQATHPEVATLASSRCSDGSGTPLNSDEIADGQPSSQPMSLATAMFYVEYTRGAFQVRRRVRTSSSWCRHTTTETRVAGAVATPFMRRVRIIHR